MAPPRRLPPQPPPTAVPSPPLPVCLPSPSAALATSGTATRTVPCSTSRLHGWCHSWTRPTWPLLSPDPASRGPAQCTTPKAGRAPNSTLGLLGADAANALTRPLQRGRQSSRSPASGPASSAAARTPCGQRVRREPGCHHVGGRGDGMHGAGKAALRWRRVPRRLSHGQGGALQRTRSRRQSRGCAKGHGREGPGGATAPLPTWSTRAPTGLQVRGLRQAGQHRRRRRSGRRGAGWQHNGQCGEGVLQGVWESPGVGSQEGADGGRSLRQPGTQDA